MVRNVGHLSETSGSSYSACDMMVGLVESMESLVGVGRLLSDRQLRYHTHTTPLAWQPALDRREEPILHIDQMVVLPESQPAIASDKTWAMCRVSAMGRCSLERFNAAIVASTQ